MKSFLQGKKALAIEPLRPSFAPQPAIASAASKSAATPSAGHHAAAPGHAPTVEVVKEGDKVVRLVVVCRCGERVEIECLYPSGL